MKKLEIINKNNYEYNLRDEEQHTYNLYLDFLDLIDKPCVGDYIYINNELLNPKYEGYSTHYTFGNLESKYGRANLSMDDIDVIRVIMNEMEIYLKRLYG